MGQCRPPPARAVPGHRARAQHAAGAHQRQHAVNAPAQPEQRHRQNGPNQRRGGVCQNQLKRIPAQIGELSEHQQRPQRRAQRLAQDRTPQRLEGIGQRGGVGVQVRRVRLFGRAEQMQGPVVQHILPAAFFIKFLLARGQAALIGTDLEAVAQARGRSRGKTRQHCARLLHPQAARRKLGVPALPLGQGPARQAQLIAAFFHSFRPPRSMRRRAPWRADGCIPRAGLPSPRL